MSKRETVEVGIVHPAEFWMSKSMHEALSGDNFKLLMKKLEKERLKSINHKQSYEDR